METLFILEYSQEIPAAAEFEIRNFSNTFNISVHLMEGGIALLGGYHSSMGDSAFITRVSRVVSAGDSPSVFSEAELPNGKFHIRFLDMQSCHDSRMEPELGKVLHAEGRVTFRNPDFIVRVYHLDRWYLGIQEFSGNGKGFEDRRAPKRPFFSPISMHPRIARFLVNVSNTPARGILLDPFCGTGGIILEAALTGRRVIGIDLSLQMTSGAKLNLKYFGIRDARIITGDFLKIQIDDTVDSIVTDLPYGRNAPMYRQKIEKLYEEALLKFSDMLSSGKRCVIAVSDMSLISGYGEYFNIIEVVKHRIHRSLTRHYVVMERR